MGQFSTDQRGQAHTLEALIATIIMLTAVVFALNAVVITPTTSGTVDRNAQAGVQEQIGDTLSAAESDGELTHMLLYTNNSSEAFAGDWDATSGYEDWPNEPFADFGQTLDAIAADRGLRYNVELAWYENTTRQTERIRYVGSPGTDAVVASQYVVLTEEMELTAPDSESQTISEAPHPVGDSNEEYIYNVVEVRVVAW